MALDLQCLSLLRSLGRMMMFQKGIRDCSGFGIRKLVFRVLISFLGSKGTFLIRRLVRPQRFLNRVHLEISLDWSIEKPYS